VSETLEINGMDYENVPSSNFWLKEIARSLVGEYEEAKLEAQRQFVNLYEHSDEHHTEVFQPRLASFNFV
jgi:hypothetical protein